MVPGPHTVQVVVSLLQRGGYLLGHNYRTGMIMIIGGIMVWEL